MKRHESGIQFQAADVGKPGIGNRIESFLIVIEYLGRGHRSRAIAELDERDEKLGRGDERSLTCAGAVGVEKTADANRASRVGALGGADGAVALLDMDGDPGAFSSGRPGNRDRRVGDSRHARAVIHVIECGSADLVVAASSGNRDFRDDAIDDRERLLGRPHIDERLASAQRVDRVRENFALVGIGGILRHAGAAEIHTVASVYENLSAFTSRRSNRECHVTSPCLYCLIHIGDREHGITDVIRPGAPEC